MQSSSNRSGARLCGCCFLSCVALCGCAAPPSAPSAPRAYDSAVALQNQRQEYFEGWLAKARTAQTAFLICAKSYAANHLQTTLTATELGGAAVAACTQELSEFRHDEYVAYTLIDENAADAQADRAVAQVTDAAKGQVLQMMAERPAKP